MKPIHSIFLIVLVDVLGLTIVLPLLPFYTENLGATPIIVGAVIAIYAAFQLIAGPILGSLSDHYGRKSILIISQMGTFVSFVMLAEAQTLWLVFVARALDGFTAGNLPLAQAYISDVTSPSERARSFGLVGIAFGIGFLVGPAISGVLAQYGYKYPLYAAAALSFLSILATFVLLPQTKRLSDKRFTLTNVFNSFNGKRFFKPLNMRLLMGEYFLFCFAFSIFVGGLALFLERRFHYTVKEVGFVFAYCGLVGIILQGFMIKPLLKHFEENKLATGSFLFSTVGLLLLGFSYTVPLLLLALTFVGIGTGLARPILTSLITQHAGRHEQGSVLGISQSLMSFSQIIGPLLAGYFIEGAHLISWAISSAVVCIVAAYFCTRNKPYLAVSRSRC